MSSSFCMSVTYPHKHTHTHTRTRTQMVYWIRKSWFPQPQKCCRKAARPAQLIVAGQLIQLLLLWSIPCAHGIDGRAKFGLSLYTSDIQKTFLPAT